MLADLRLAVRALSNKPGFAASAILTIALGVGASTAIFSVVSGVLLRALPYPDSDRLTEIWTEFESGNIGSTSHPDFEDLKDQGESFDAMAAYYAGPISVVSSGAGFRAIRAGVSPEFFDVLGVEAMRGRVFGADGSPVDNQGAVVSYGYWQGRLGGTDDLAAHSVAEGNRSYTIVGVMPPDFNFPAGTEFWVPRPVQTENRTAHNYRVIGRLRSGVSITQAQQELSAIARRLKQQHGDDADMVDADVRSLLDGLVGDLRAALTLLLGAAGVLLVVACANVANLLLARGLAREHESAVRVALGAPVSRIARAILAESLVLALAGAFLGVVIARAAMPALLLMAPVALPRAENIDVDWRALAFALAISVLAAALMALVPVLRTRKRNLRPILADGQRTRGGDAASHRFREVLVVAQISLTVVLLVAAGLLARSFVALLDTNPGYRTDGGIVMDLWLRRPPCTVTANSMTCDDAATSANAAFIERLMTQLGALPGVERVGGVSRLPLGEGFDPNGTFVKLQRPDEISSFEDHLTLARQPERVGNAEFRIASAGYFGAMGIPLIDGRLFDERDTADTTHVAVVSASLAAETWPGEDPLGRLVQFGNMDGDLTPFTIVGIVGDIQERALGTEPRPTFYVDYRQRTRTVSAFHIVMQGAEVNAGTAPAARRVAMALDPLVPIALRALSEVKTASVTDRRFVLLLVSIFGAVALALAGIGVYGVTAYVATERVPEIGVRVAFGARGRDVIRLFLGQGVILAVVGVLVGSVAALILTHLLRIFLYDVGAADPATFIGVALTLVTVVALASFVPAYGASRRDATEALRHC